MLVPFAAVSFAINLATLYPLAFEGIVPWFNNIVAEQRPTPYSLRTAITQVLRDLRDCNVPIDGHSLEFDPSLAPPKERCCEEGCCSCCGSNCNCKSENYQ